AESRGAAPRCQAGHSRTPSLSLVKGSPHLRCVYWLREMEVESGLGRMAPVRILTPSGYGNDRQRPLACAPANLARRIIPVQLRQPEIQQYDVGPKRICSTDRLNTVVRLANFVPEELHQLTEARGRIEVVIYNQYFSSLAGS